MVTVLTRKDVESLLTMKDAMVAADQAFREISLRTVEMPLRSVISVQKYKGRTTFMPAYMVGADGLGMKLVTNYPDNPAKYNLPTILGTILLNDPRTGALLAIMDGAWITAMRTGAASGIATKYLARENARTVGIFGTGVQARTQLIAMKQVRKLDEVKAYDIVLQNSRKFSEEMTERLGIPVRSEENPTEVVRGSDIIITTTSSKVPIFSGNLLEDGVHVNGIGSHHGPGIKELDEVTIRRAKVVVDHRDACLKEAGDLIDPISKGIVSADHIYAELGELVIGKKKGRTNNTEITVFKSVGVAVQDLSTALKVYELAAAKGIGKTIEI